MDEIQLNSIPIEVTKRCNLYCKFCYAEASNKQNQQELTGEQICTFLEQFRYQGGRKVLFTGGEVLLRHDIYHLITYAKSLGLIVDMFSNGTLITPQIAEYIAKYVNSITISIDGPSYVHDMLRGVRGSFESATYAIELLCDAGARFSIQCMIVPDNIDKMNWLIYFAQRTKPVMIKLGHVSLLGRGRYQSSILLNEEQMLYLKELAGKISEECNHFHTRVVTNVITAQEFKAFYPNFKHVLQPWMLSDGRILSCYVNHFTQYWTLSTAEAYPLPLKGALERRERLALLAHQRASRLTCFDFMELVSYVAEEIAEKAY
jgi:MoaA/NifB/PqqE/SkfB family radical SAM enzyme